MSHHPGDLSEKPENIPRTPGVLPARLPIGYAWAGRGRDRSAVPDPGEAPLVQESFVRAASEDIPVRALLEEMTRKGLLSRSGKPMGVSAFWKVLSNPFYAGKVRSGGNVADGPQPPLVPEALFARAQERLASRNRRRCTK